MFFAAAASGQGYVRELSTEPGGTVEVVNMAGRIGVTAVHGESVKRELLAVSETAVSDTEIKIENVKGRTVITVVPGSSKRRIDLTLQLPERTRLKLRTGEGEIRAEGNFEQIEAETDTGTIAVDLPTMELRYEMQWLASRPRFLADFDLEPVKEKAAGRFQIKGTYKSEDAGGTDEPSGEKPDKEAKKAARVDLKTATQRGIVLINVPPNEVMADLRERPLTNAARSMIRSGDSVMMDAIRRAAPKYFGEFMRTLPPREREPQLTSESERQGPAAAVKRATVHVIDSFNRSVPGLEADEFEVAEGGDPKEIISVRPVEAPVNLVLLLDVSGSIENYVTFIRKAARAFVDTVDKNDRVSILTFNDDVKVLAGFTTDKSKLAESLDSFDAGGPTAYYDALGYALSESLRPLRNERTAIVVLTDGDDNRSFLAFDSLTGAIEESGALIYPLYVPSSLIAASAATGFGDIDPLRNRHLTLTSKADAEGRQLAKISGGQYYPITQLSQIQTAYEDIVVQLRTAYDITYSTAASGTRNTRQEGNGPETRRTMNPQRLRVRVKRPNAFVQVGPVVPVAVP